MTIDTQAIKNLLQREAVESEDETQYALQADNKLKQILHDAEGDSSAVADVAQIQSFVNADQVSRRKLLAYCMDFVDSTARVPSDVCGTQVCLHTYLQKTEIYKLVDFINSHRHDATFGDTVYSVMNSHGMTPPQVYKNAMLRRQDFARATSCASDGNVTKRIAWQIIVGLHCNLDEADKILLSAGYMRRKNATDLIMEYFIQKENYDMAAVNHVFQELGMKQFPCWEPNERSAK